MQQTRDEITENLTERLCWEVARRYETRIARRLYRKPVVDRVYRLDKGALLEDFLHLLQALGVMDLLADVHGTAIQREMVPFVRHILLYGLKTLFGIERNNALPSLLCSDEALMQLVGFNAPQVPQAVCQRGAGQQQRERLPGSLCPDTLAQKIVKLNVWDLEGVLKSAIRALAKAGIFGQRVTGIADGTDPVTTDGYRGGGQVTRTRCLEDQRGRMQDIEVTVQGWNVLLLIDPATKIPLAVRVGKIQEQESHQIPALVTQAQAHLARDARRHKVVVDQGLGMVQTPGGWTRSVSPVSCRQKRTWP